MTGLQFDDVWSIDPDSLRQAAPLYGAIFLFKYRRSEFAARKRKMQQEYAATGRVAQPEDGTYDQSVDGGAPRVFFAHQVIQNACATQAVLSLLMNTVGVPDDEEAAADDGVALGPVLTGFREFVESFDAELKGEAISNSDTVRAVHNSFSRPSPFVDDDRDAPQDRDEEDDGLFHFVAYVPVGGRLYELDGLHPFPIVHETTVSNGRCTRASFPEDLAAVLARRIARAPAGDLRFNLLALTADPRARLAAAGDAEGLAREAIKRAQWRRENILRRANYAGLVTALVRGLAAQHDSEAAWHDKVLAPAQQKSREMYTAASKR